MDCCGKESGEQQTSSPAAIKTDPSRGKQEETDRFNDNFFRMIPAHLKIRSKTFRILVLVDRESRRTAEYVAPYHQLNECVKVYFSCVFLYSAYEVKLLLER